MSLARSLPRLLAWDVRVQARESIYGFTVLTTLAFATVIWLLPDPAPDRVVTMVLFLDPAVVGTGFVAALVLMERSQNTLAAVAVSPAPPQSYVLSKVITLTGLTFVGGMALVAIAYWPLPPAQALRFVIAMAFTGSFGVVLGLVLVATADSINHVIARAFPISVVLYLPLLAHFELVGGGWAWLFAPDPGHAMLRALLWAADPAAVTTAEVVYAFGFLGLLVIALFAWALRLFRDTIGRGAP